MNKKKGNKIFGLKTNGIIARIIVLSFSLLAFLLSSVETFSKEIVVLDSLSRESLPYANISLENDKRQGVVSDETGKAILPVKFFGKTLDISYSGYNSKKYQNDFSGFSDTVFLSPISFQLKEVFVKPKKEKYSKKNNPAIDFMKKIKEMAEEHNPENQDFYSYDKYEKTVIALNDFNGNFDEGFLGSKMNFLKEYVDTSSWTGSRLLDLMLKEKVSTNIKSKEPKVDKEITLGYRSSGVDEMLNQENIQIMLEDVVREVDVFSPSINIMQNRFVSPLSSIGVDFYRYYLSDTVYIGNEKCVELSFAPVNPQSMGFNGKIYVPVGDTTMFVKKISMRTPHDINLNFLRNLFINQSFEKDSLGNRHKTYDDVCVELQIVAGTPVFYGRKTGVYDNFSYEMRKDLEPYYFKIGDNFSLTDSIGETAEFWNEKRMVPLTYAESRMIGLTENMRKVPLLYWAEKIVGFIERGYFTTGNPSKFDIGPANSMISYNSVEGLRLRAGGMTMAALNPHIFASGYVAYGFHDKIWKYGARLEYSFPKKKNHVNEWPRNGIYASYSYDLDMIGQHYLFTNQDNFLLSFRRKKSDLVTYRRLAQAGYVLELPNNFSIEAGLKYEIQESTKWLPFIYSNGDFASHYTSASFNISLRWAKGEKFVQTHTARLPVNMDPWIIQITHEYGPKRLFGASFTTNKTELSVQKRFWLSAFGYIDMILKGGKVWSQVYYPALMWPNANLSYTIQPESYSLMDPMEFANDTYASIDCTYFGNGILFNRIPLINKLHLREAITFKALSGTLTNRNNPEYNDNIYLFPQDCYSMKMRSMPYMEIGAGIDNIFSIIRIDYVWRLSYRNTPGVDKSGLRFSLHLAF